MTRVKLKTLGLVAVPLTGALVVILGLLFRDDGAARELRLRQRAELDRTLEAERLTRATSAEKALNAFRTSQLAGASSAVDPKASRQELIKHGERAVPVIKATVYDAKESTSLRLELIGVLADLKTASADAVMLDILRDKSLQEPYRAVVLGKLAGRPVEDSYSTLRRMVEEERQFSNRALLLKAIGELSRPEVTPVLIHALTNEQSASARIQAADSLGRRAGAPEVTEVLRQRILEDADEQVRLAALASLGKSSASGIDSLLAQILENPQASDPLKKAAASWIEKRRRKS